LPTYRKPPTAYKKRWHARAKRDGMEWSLGYYETREEAETEERKFADEYDVKQDKKG